MARRIVIDWDDYTARTWWTWGSGRRAPYPGRRRAWFAMLREWVLDSVYAVARLVSRGDDPSLSPTAPRVPLSAPIYAAPAAPIAPRVMRGAIAILAPPRGRRSVAGRLTL